MTAGSRAEAFAGLTCSAPEARTRDMTEIVLRFAPERAHLRVLDLGCGTGELVFRLADRLPSATFAGVDISSMNVAAAEQVRRSRADADRISFHAADYLTWDTPPFDVITTYSVLHLIPVDTGELVAKISRDVVPDGIVVNGMPTGSWYNTAVALARRALRQIRSSWSDALILRLARMLHRDTSDRALRERVHYMYVVPERMNDSRFVAECGRRGLRPIATIPVKSTSLAQLRHSVTVLRKDA